LLKLKFYAEKETPPPQVKIEFSLKKLDMFFQWTPEANWRSDLPFFGGARPLSRAFSHYSPFMVVYNQKGGNRFALAVSEALRKIVIDYGVKTYAGYCLSFAITLFSEAEAPLKEYEVELRFDRRRAAYSEIASDIVKWYESFPSTSPPSRRKSPSNPSTRPGTAIGRKSKPSRWRPNARWRAPTDEGRDRGRRLADRQERRLPQLRSLDPAKSKFPDMRGHVERVHALGMKYLLWIGLPFIGCDSPLFNASKANISSAAGATPTSSIRASGSPRIPGLALRGDAPRLGT
jgi:alpha-galactosidase